MSGIEILYRADGCAVVKKPVGADSEDKGENSVPALVRAELSCEYAEPVHRLDLAVGGAMLVATDRQSAARLSADIAQGKITKEYLCVCEGVLDEAEGEMQDLLFFDRAKRKSFTVKKPRRGVKQASLSYSTVGRAVTDGGREVSLVRVHLHTGRTHQIRVQFASRRHPLLGDGKYGSRDNGCTVALICRAVTVDGVRVECVPEDVYPWNMF